MRYFKTFLIFLIINTFVFNLWAQEFRCNVQVQTPKIQGSNKSVFEAMRKSISEFMNDSKWTDHVFGTEERIECSIMIIVNEMIGSERFIATLQVQSRRPIFGSSYNSTILNYKEKENDFHFEYTENQSLEFTPNSHSSNLTSVLAFYAYIILGLDYDSFSPEGGTEFYQKAQDIVNLAQSSADPGWKAFENLENRYWMVENLLNATYSPIRRFLYDYHRLGLDVMSEKPDNGRNEIAESLKLLQKVHRRKPNSFLMALIFVSKQSEFTKVFSEGFPDEKKRAYNVLVEIDAKNTSKYDQMLK